MANPKVSVVVPIYKVEKYLMQCIDSILNQTLQDIEVILVDEGDIDTCRAIIDMYEFGPKKDPRVKTIHERNGGYGSSVNKGFDIATGEYISIIESDDFIAPEMYEEMYNYAKKLDADVVKTPYYEYFDKTSDIDEVINPCFWQKMVKKVPENVTFSIEEYPILMGIHPSIWAALYKREYLVNKNIRCIEARGAGYIDNHFRTQTFCQTDKLCYLNKPFNYYRLSNEDASTVHYNLSTFIQRWKDVHELFEEKFPEKWDKLAPYCISEEWVNTLFRVLKENYVLSNEDYHILKDNLSKTSVEQINESTHLCKKDKKAILRVKNNYDILKKYIKKETKKNKLKRINILGLDIITIKKKKANTHMAYLLNIIPLFKTKKRNNELLKVYLFGLFPIFDIKG